MSRRPPVVCQSTENECGLACLAMIQGAHGRQVTLAALRRRFGLFDQPLRIADLLRLGDEMGYQTRALRCEIDELSALRLPAILHFDFRHYVVLAAVSRRSVVIHDPAVGRRHLPLSKLSRHFTGVVVEFVRRDDAVTSHTDAPPESALSLFGSLTPVIPALLQLLLLTVLLQGLTLAMPLYLQLVVDAALANLDAELLPVLAIGFAALAGITLVARGLQEITGLFIGSQLGLLMGTRLFGHLIRLPTGFFHARHMGDITSRFESTGAIGGFITGGLVSLLLNIVMVLTTATALFFYDAGLTLIVVVTGAVLVAGKLMFYWPLRHRQHENILVGAELDSYFMESVRTVSAIHRYSAQVSRSNEYANRLVDVTNSTLRLGYLRISYGLFSSGLRTFLYVLIVYLLARSVLEQTLTIGMLYAFLAYYERLVSALESLTTEVLNALMLRLHMERLSDITTTRAVPSSTRQIASQPQTQSGTALALIRVGFSYGDESIMDDLSITLSPGQQLAVFGPSGSGKTTLLRICQGMIKPDSGLVRINGTTVAEGDGARHGVASVMSEDTLLKGSIMDNITFGSQEPDRRRGIRCARLALLHDQICVHPLGYDRQIHEMDQSLSAGQAQRILLARALYHRPTLLFLDEGTAHLDRRSAIVIMRRIRKMGITCLYTTHSPELARLADQVLNTGRSPWCLASQPGRS
jgi:ATP-binding cassette subfamily B protein RaxB